MHDLITLVQALSAESSPGSWRALKVSESTRRALQHSESSQTLLMSSSSFLPSSAAVFHSGANSNSFAYQSNSETESTKFMTEFDFRYAKEMEIWHNGTEQLEAENKGTYASELIRN